MVNLLSFQFFLIAFLCTFFLNSKLKIESQFTENSIIIEFKNTSKDSIYFNFNLSNARLMSNKNKVDWSDSEVDNLSSEDLINLLNRSQEFPFENIKDSLLTQEFYKYKKAKYLIANKTENLNFNEEENLKNILQIIEYSRGTTIFLRPNETYIIELKPDFLKQDKPASFKLKEPNKFYLLRYLTYYDIKWGKKIRIPIIPPKVLGGFKRYDKGFKTKTLRS